MTLTESLTHLIRNKPVSEDDLHKTALFTLDAVVNLIAGRNSVVGQKLLQWGAARQNDEGRRAFVMGGLIHILEVDDVHRASIVHTGCVTVPVALALAQNREIPGHTFLKSILYGFEAACRVGMSVGPSHYKVWHNTATCGPYGSAMTAATLLKLNDQQTMHALGNAGTQSAGFWEFLKPGAMSKHLHAARAAEAGLVSAELAALNFTGPPKILEGDSGFYAGACPDPNPDAVVRDPDGKWQVHLTSIKPWPSCRHTHPAIDASLAVYAELDGERIEEVKVNTYQAAIDVCDRPIASTEYEGKFSIQHCVAAALQRGKIDFSAFGVTARAEAAKLSKKVNLFTSEPYMSSFPGSWGAGVSVTLENGKKIESSKPECKGDPESMLGEVEMIEKAQDLLRFGGVNDPSQIINSIIDMPNSNNPVDLTPILSAAA